MITPNDAGGYFIVKQFPYCQTDRKSHITSDLIMADYQTPNLDYNDMLEEWDINGRTDRSGRYA